MAALPLWAGRNPRYQSNTQRKGSAEAQSSFTAYGKLYVRRGRRLKHDLNIYEFFEILKKGGEIIILTLIDFLSN